MLKWIFGNKEKTNELTVPEKTKNTNFSEDQVKEIVEKVALVVKTKGDGQLVEQQKEIIQSLRDDKKDLKSEIRELKKENNELRKQNESLKPTLRVKPKFIGKQKQIIDLYEKLKDDSNRETTIRNLMIDLGYDVDNEKTFASDYKTVNNYIYQIRKKGYEMEWYD